MSLEGTETWNAVIQETTLEQLDQRERDSNLSFDRYHPRRTYFSESDHELEVWDELTKKKLVREEVLNARVGSHDVCDKVPLEECWQSTGKGPVKAKQIDMSKAGEVHHEYRSRVVAKEMQIYKHLHLFAASPPLDAKKAVCQQPVTEGFGHSQRHPESGMKINFVDIRRAFFQAAAIREVIVELSGDDYEKGMCGKPKKSMDSTRDAAQNWGETHTQIVIDSGFERGQSSPCVFWTPVMN